jgi:hypothetical protein
MKLKKYMAQRRNELLEELNPDCVTVFNACYDFVEKVVESNFAEVSPDFVRKIELLEALLFGFIEHGLNPELLDDIEQQIASVSMRGTKALQ